MERILIVRLSAMGDILNSLPVAAALRKQYPDSVIDWVVEEQWAEMLRASGSPACGPLAAEKPVVNEVHLVNTRRWRKNVFARRTMSDIVSLRRTLRERKYTAVFDVQGALRSAVIARFSRSPRIIGFEKPREPQAKYFYTQRIQALGAHIIEQNVSLTGQNVPAPSETLLPRDASAEAWAVAELRRSDIASDFAVMSPGAGWGAKEWSPQRYGEVAAMLARDGVQTLVNVGPKETELAAIVQRASGGIAKPLQCSIGQLIAILRRASLFIAGDTGPMHLANLIGVPVVAVFGPTDPARNGPFYPPFEVVRHQSSSTDYGHHDREHEGLLNTSSAEVYAAARKLLSQ